MKKIITVVLLMFAINVSAQQDLCKFTVELLNNMLNKYDMCKIVSPDYAIVESGEKKGVVDYNGNIVLPIKYRKIEDFSDGMAVVQDENYKYGYVDDNFKITIPCIYTKATDFINGLAVVSDKNDNSKVIETDYIAEWEGDDYDDNSKFIDKKGQIDQVSTRLLKCFPTRYESGFCVSGDLLVIESPGKVKSFQIDSLDVSISGCAIITDNNKYRVLTPSGWFKSGVYDDVLDYHYHKITKKLGKKGLLDINGKEIVPCIYEDINLPSQDNQEIIAVKKNGKWGIVDTSGRQILAFIYSWADVYNDNIIKVEYDDKPTEIINRNGDKVFQIIPEYIRTINNYAIFKFDGMYYAINNEFKTPFCSDKLIFSIYNDFAIIIDDYKKGLINGFGGIVLPCEYDEIDYEYGIFKVYKNGKSSYIECLNVKKIIDEIDYYLNQADSDKEKGKYDEYIAKLTKVDEKITILEKNPDLYDSRIANIIKPEKERIKGLIDEATKLLNNK